MNYITKVKKDIENIDINYDFKTIVKNNLEIIEITKYQIEKCVKYICILLFIWIFSDKFVKIFFSGLILFAIIEYIVITLHEALQNIINITANKKELIIKEHKKEIRIPFCNLISVRDNLDFPLIDDKEFFIRYICDNKIETYSKKISQSKPYRIYMIEEDVKKLTETFMYCEDSINKSEEELEQYRDIERNFNIEEKLEQFEERERRKRKKNNKRIQRIFRIYFIIFIAILGYAVYIRIRQYII